MKYITWEKSIFNHQNLYVHRMFDTKNWWHLPIQIGCLFICSCSYIVEKSFFWHIINLYVNRKRKSKCSRIYHTIVRHTTVLLLLSLNRIWVYYHQLCSFVTFALPLLKCTNRLELRGKRQPIVCRREIKSI